MDKFPKAKVKFIASMLLVKHSKRGVRTVTKMFAQMHLDKLTFSKSEDRVLHVGCGTGDETLVIADRAKTVVGVSADPEVLQIAKREATADNVEYIQDDLRDASPNVVQWRGSFDKVVVFIRVMLFPDTSAAIRNMVACLKPGGELLCVFSNNDYNFFGGAAKLIQEHPEWGQRVKAKGNNVSMWSKTEAGTLSYFQDLANWSHLVAEYEYKDLPLSEDRAKLIWLDCLEHVTDIDQSRQAECLEALWQWAKHEYECTSDNVIKKPMEMMLIHGVKAQDDMT